MITSCGAAPPLQERDVNDTRLSVAQMGPELIQKATIEHPDFEILVVGRSYNPAPSVTFCTFRGFKDPGVDYHMGKIMEYGASCATPKSTSALAIVRKEPSRFEVRPHWPDRRTQTRGYRGHGNKLGFEFDCKIHVHGNNGVIESRESVPRSVSKEIAIKDTSVQKSQHKQKRHANF